MNPSGNANAVAFWLMASLGKNLLSHILHFRLMGSLENFVFEFTLPVQTLIKSQLNVYQEL